MINLIWNPYFKEDYEYCHGEITPADFMPTYIYIFYFTCFCFDYFKILID